MPRPALPLLLFVIALATSLSAGPEQWRAATQAEFLKGDLDQVSVDEHGRLTLGPAISRLYDTGAPFVWAAVEDGAGSVYLGTGNDGKVFKVDAGGRGSLFHDTAELEVHALAIAPGGGLYVGTSPDGRVYKVDASGAAAPFFDPEEKYIWAIATDATGQVYVATGDPKGKVYRVSAAGAATPLFTSTASHVVSLTFDGQRRVVAGTESPGRVYRLEASGRAFLLLDTNLQEVRAIRADSRGRLFVVAQARRAAGGDAGGGDGAVSAPEPPRAPVPNVTVSITSMAVLDPQPAAAAGGASGAAPGPVTGAIFRIDADGAAESIWETHDDTPYDVAPQPDGALLVATGHRGKIYRLDGDPLRATLLGRVPGRQAIQLLPSATRTLVATSNSGALVRVDTAHADRGTYLSDVRDAKTTARWGAIAWRATTPPGSRVEVSTRSGNTATPDDGWSDWSPAAGNADGTPVASPAARYLQWRVTLSGKASPVLTSVSAAYLQRNQRPAVSGLVVHPPGVVFQKPFSTGETEIAGYRAEAIERRLSNQGQPPPSTGAPTLGRRTYQQGLQTIVWKGDDANGDDLSFDVAFRREGETTWTALAAELADPIYVWDTASVPSGHYVIKISASDAPSQPADLAMRGELESSVVEVDAVAPVVTVRPGARAGDRLTVAVEVRDQHSTVTRVEYALDGAAWSPAYPADGLLDSPNETLTLSFPPAAQGKVLVVRATDALHNVGVGDATLK